MLTVNVTISQCKKCPYAEWYSAFDKTRVSKSVRHLMCNEMKMTVDPNRIHKLCPLLKKDGEI